MEQVFECLKCGEATPITELPARCSRCGYGNGIVRPADEPPARPEPEERRHYYEAEVVRSMKVPPTLTETQILLLLDNCLLKARHCKARELEAEARGQHSRVQYLRKLKAHYVAIQETLEDQIFRQGITPSDLAHSLAHLDRRCEPPSESPADLVNLSAETSR
jgi:hypothetical protein